MQNTAVPLDITLVIVLVVIAFVGICIAGFVVFTRFLGIEKERGRRFRKIHSKPRKNDEQL